MNRTSSSSSRSSQHVLTPPRAKPERKGDTPDGPRVLPRPRPPGSPADARASQALKDKVIRETRDAAKAHAQPESKHGSRPVVAEPPTLRERLQLLQVLASTTVMAVARRAGLDKPLLDDLTRLNKMVGELTRLASLPRGEMPDKLADALIQRVIDAASSSHTVNIGVVSYALTDLIGGQAMSAQRAQSLVQQMLQAHECLPDETLLMCLLGVAGVLGGSRMSAAHRQAMLQGGMNVLDATADEDRVYVASGLLNAMTHADDHTYEVPPMGATGGTRAWQVTDHRCNIGDPTGSAHLQAIVNLTVSPHLEAGQPAQEAMLQAVAWLVQAHRGPQATSQAYLDLLRKAPAFDPSLHASVAGSLPMRVILGDDATDAQSLARITAFARGLADWAAELEAPCAAALGEGLYERMWTDLELTGPQFAAALRGLLRDCSTSLDAPSAWILTGFLREALGAADRLDAEQIEAFYDVADSFTQPDQASLRREFGALLTLALNHALWPDPHMERVLDAMVARADSTRWRPAWVGVAGIWMGDCLRDLSLHDPLVEHVVERFAAVRLQDTANLLVGGFVHAQLITPDQPGQVDAVLRALALPRFDPDQRGAILACHVAVILGLRSEDTQAANPLARHFRLGAHDLQRSDPLALGLALACRPMRTVMNQWLSNDELAGLFEAVCCIEGVIASAQDMQAALDQLLEPGWCEDADLRADLLLTLFLHRGHLALPTHMARAREALVDEAQALPDSKGPQDPRRALSEDRRSQLDALYRYYVTASRFPFNSQATPPEVLRERLVSIESAMRQTPDSVFPEEREMIEWLRKVHAEHLAR